jgi:anti-sigma factor RsiW
MNCTRIEELIDDFVDGRLAADERREVERHLENCSACRSSVEQLRSIIEGAAALPREIQPSRDLLPGIRCAVDGGGGAKPGGAWVWWAGLAATVIILITALLTGVVLNEPDGVEALNERSQDGALEAGSDAVSEIRAAEKEYIRAAAVLAELLEQRRDTLPPETAALVDENLEIINQAIVNVRLALDADPADPETGQVLTALYRQKIEILRRVSRLSS